MCSLSSLVASEMICRSLSASQTRCTPQRLTVQILREQGHSVLLPQGIRGLPAEVDGSLRSISLQGKPFNFKKKKSFTYTHFFPVFVSFCRVCFPLPEFTK